jgi:hypothetical protein
MSEEKGAGVPDMVKAPPPKKEAKPRDYDGSVYFAENTRWTPGEIVQFVGAGREVHAVVATRDNRLVSVKLSEIRHGITEPDSLPQLHAVTATGVRQHTLTKHHTGKFLVASPDGIIKGEYDDENDAKAKLAALTLPAAPALERKGQWKEAS